MIRSRHPLNTAWLRRWTMAAALLAVSLPAWGYIVFLKDGSQIQTKEKYRIVGDKAILVLPSGTEASYDASEIDVEKTERVNVVDYGTARLLEGLEGRDKDKAPPPQEPSFGEYISGRSLALPQVRKRQVKKKLEGEMPYTQAGFIDLMTLRREPYPNVEVTGEVLGYLKGQGVDRVRIFQGTEPDRPLLEIVTTSEASVFKALKDSAHGLVQIHERFKDQVAAFELVLMTESQARAGQFLLTPERADLLVSGQLKEPGFFLRYVEF